MNSKLLLGLTVASGCVLLVLVGLLAVTVWGPRAKSDDGARGVTANPPAPPKAVANPERVRQQLQPGKTYATHTKGTLHVRATDKAWGVEEVVTVNYAFEATIDREIESNDGTTIVELRHFRDLRSLKVDSRLEDLRLEIGPPGDLLLAGIAYFQPEAAGPAAVAIKAIDGAHLKPALSALRWAGVSPEQLSGLDQSVKAFAAVDRLSGKSVRLTYVDGKGVIKLESVQGDMTPAERDFHLASVLVSDSLIVPNVDIQTGNRWEVDGSNFANVVDPSLLARTSGTLTLERGPDYLVQGKTCRHIQVVAGRIQFDDSDPRVGQIGYFDPQGALDFSPDDQVIIQARLQGKASLERFSRDHLLFETRMRALPELDILYTCRVVDTPKGKQP